jgi:hypothetical protein
MKRIQTSTAVANKFGVGKAGFTDGDPVTGIPTTDLEGRWFDQVQEGQVRTIERAGLTPSDDLDQFTDAIELLIEARVGDYAPDTGAVNASVVAMNPAVAAYTGGMEVKFRVNVANTGACTLNAGGGARGLVRNDGAALIAGDLPLGILVTATYDATLNKFVISSLVTSQTLTQAMADARYVQIGAAFAPGVIVDFGGTSAPAGFLGCPVAPTVVSRATYANLFAAIGTTWGVGDGATTFGIPWFAAGEVGVQASGNVGTHTSGAVISHTHGETGAFYDVGTTTGTSAIVHKGVETANATTTGATGGTNNLAAGQRVLKIVKY